MYSGSYDGGCTFLTLERKLTLPASERSPPLCTCCKGGFVVFFWVPCCPDSAPDDRDNVAAVSTDIGVTFSSLKLSCQRWTRRRRLLRAAKEISKHRASTLTFADFLLPVFQSDHTLRMNESTLSVFADSSPFNS